MISARHMMISLAILSVTWVATPRQTPPPVSTAVRPVRETAAVPHDADDPALWLSPVDPSKSLVLATDKFAVEGGLYVFALDGTLRQTIAPIDRPNNVDVEYGLSFGGRSIDIAVVTERLRHRLRVFEIPRDGGALIDLAPAGLPVLAGEAGEAAEPMGIALYRRPSDGVVFAIVAPKTGGSAEYLWQYRLRDAGQGRVEATLARRFGAFSRIGPEPGDIGEIEAVVVDDEMGFVYYSDERFGIRKYPADPDASGAAVELASFGRDGYLGDREGLAVYATGPRTGFIVSSDQIEGNTRVILYPREGTAGRPHDHPSLATIATSSDSTDGLDVVSAPLPGFPQGLVVMMNSGARNFLMYRWEDIRAAIPGLAPPMR
jgi:3-phytase